MYNETQQEGSAVDLHKKQKNKLLNCGKIVKQKQITGENRISPKDIKFCELYDISLFLKEEKICYV